MRPPRGHISLRSAVVVACRGLEVRPSYPLPTPATRFYSPCSHPPWRFPETALIASELSFMSRSLRSSPLLPDGQIVPLFTSWLGVKAPSALYGHYRQTISLSPRPTPLIISPAMPSRSSVPERTARPPPGAPQNGKRLEAGSLVASFAPYAATHLHRRIMPLFATQRSKGTSSAFCVERRHPV